MYITIGVTKLNKIICSEKLRPKLSTVLVIKDKRIKIGDYNIYSNIEHIEIPYDAIVEEGFLNQFKYLKSIKCEPKLLLNLDFGFLYIIGLLSVFGLFSLFLAYASDEAESARFPNMTLFLYG